MWVECTEGRWAVDGVFVRAPEEDVLANLRHALQLLAASAQEQVAHYASIEMVDQPAAQMALNLVVWAGGAQYRRLLTEEQVAQLQAVEAVFDDLDASEDEAAAWSSEALASDPQWEEVRTLAQAALASLDWAAEIPPPAYYSD